MDIDYFKEQLMAKEEMLAQTTRFMLQIQENLKAKNLELQNANKDIFDSINFASLIQKSLLPDIEILKIFFKDASYKVIQQIGIGGDTVFIKNTSKGIVFGLLDSTGHGIPAAMLSISGTLLLKELMTSMEINHPNTLFNLLNYQLHNTFNQGKASIAHQEGIICSYSTAQKTLSYSSARGKAILMRASGEIEKLNNSKKSIGEEANADFELFETEVKLGDKLILFSDGLTDQFGGEKNKKFSKDRLVKLLESNTSKGANELSDAIEQEFLLWKNANPQTDDVSYMVIEF